MYSLGLDIGSNSVGSAWLDHETGSITTGTSIFPAGVTESDEQRGDPKNVKRRSTRRTRVTLARRSLRKRELRLKLIEVGLLPGSEAEFKTLLEETDPWELRRRGLDEPLTRHEFGRVLLHLAQRRGALGLKIARSDDDGAVAGEEESADEKEDGKVKAAIAEVRLKMAERHARTFGEFIAMVRAERVHDIKGEDQRPEEKRKGRRIYRDAVRNKPGLYEHCADRGMIRDEFAKLWDKQREVGGETAAILTNELRKILDDETGDSVWRHRGLLFGQRRQTWDLGTLGRCVLEPTERCAPHADMYASHYLVVETVNNLKVTEGGKNPRPLKADERAKLMGYLRGPLGEETRGKRKGQPKRTASVTDLRLLMGTTKEGWGKATKTSRFRFNIETDPDRVINTDWFEREIVYGAIGWDAWAAMPERLREGINRAILRFDPDQDGDAQRLKSGILKWGGLSETQAEALIAGWRNRPKLDKKRLNMSRRAVRNLLKVMDQPWRDQNRPGEVRWVTQIEARKMIAEDAAFMDVTTGEPLDERARKRYAIGAKGATARDRYYMRKHVLMKNGERIIGPDGQPLSEPPPAPMISNPVVRKSIHEVRRHLIEYMTRFERKPDEVYIELAREGRMGKKDADALLFRNRLRNRIRRSIIDEYNLGSMTTTQQRIAVRRVVLCVQQGGASAVCPLCGKHEGLTPLNAAEGNGCEIAHIIPSASGGHDGFGNIVLAHTKCNRDMGRRTPREFWNATLSGGFDEGIRWVEQIYQEVMRPKPKDMKNAEGISLTQCYFHKKEDWGKIERFKMDVKDIQEMTEGQKAATTYATRQIMAYVADAIYDGEGLPERGGKRRIFATDGMWTSRLRREWGLFFDPHHSRSRDLESMEDAKAQAVRHERKEKDRGDHRHHAIDAVVIALSTESVRKVWEKREKDADAQGISTAEEEAIESYRREHPIAPPGSFAGRDELRGRVRAAVFGEGKIDRPICHRPVKRKLIGALHEESLFGPVLDQKGGLTGNYTAKKGVLSLTPNHLRVPEGWDVLSAQLENDSVSAEQKNAIRRKLAAMPDPAPGKSGIVRDRALRDRLRKCLLSTDAELLREWEVEAASDLLGEFEAQKNTVKGGVTKNQIKMIADAGQLCHKSGVPIRSVVLLRTMSDPVVIDRKVSDYTTGKMEYVSDPASRRAYVGGNNHHIEIREGSDRKGNAKWSGEIVTAFEAGQRKLARLRALSKAGVPSRKRMRQMPPADREQFGPMIREAIRNHPIVDRNDDEAKGGRFIMSLCEGETLFMRHKVTDEVGYFVVAKLDKPQSIVLVPHWDARSAGERKDSEGKKVPDSKRDQFAATPGDLLKLASPGHPHAVKIRVSPLGKIRILQHD